MNCDFFLILTNFFLSIDMFFLGLSSRVLWFKEKGKL